MATLMVFQGHVDTRALKRLGHLGNRAVETLKHLKDTQGTWELKHLDTWALDVYSGTQALRHSLVLR